MELVNDMGVDAVDAGGLDESWRQQPGTPVFAAPGTPMSRAADFDAAGVRRALAQATPERKPEWARQCTRPRHLSGSGMKHLIQHGSGVRPEHLMHSCDRHTAFANGRGAAFDRAGAYVPGSKNSRSARLHQARRTAHPFPGRRAGDCRAGFDEALSIAFNLGRQPVRAG